MSEQEEMRAMQEKMAKMSPEELQAFWKQNCVFCQILDGKISGKKIYEDKECAVIMDINPATAGHCFVLPKTHYTVGPQVPEKSMAHLGSVVRAVSHACLREIGAKGTTIFMANGAAAGQVAQHFLIHVIPRYGDDVPQLTMKTKAANPKELDQLATQLGEYISKKLGSTLQAPILPEEPEKKVVAKKPAAKEEKKEIIHRTELKRESGYLYFLDKELNIQRVNVEDAKKKRGKKETLQKNKQAQTTESKPVEEQEKKEGVDLDTISKLFS